MEIERRIHPKTKYDFTLLEKELANWVTSETMNIKASDLSDEDINTIKFDIKEILFNKFKPLAQNHFQVSILYIG